MAWTAPSHHAAPARRPSILARAGGDLTAEQDRWFLWVPVLFGAGIAVYFRLPQEPLLLPAILPAAAAFALWLAWRRGAAALCLGSAVLAVCLGLAGAKVRSDLVAAPVLARQVGPVTVTGWIELVEPRAGGGERLTVRVAAIEGFAAADLPRRVRVRVLAARGTPAGGQASVQASAAPDRKLAPGDAIRLAAVLSPPAPPALPGGFDFARSAWFAGLGAVGFARAVPEPATIAEPRPPDLAWRSAIERVRQDIGARIRAALPGETGAIANALITGERGGISERTNDAFRDSGLFHILSISGLHMVIMAGSVFLAVRFLLSLVPALALRFPIKKWAATAAAAGALGYLLISGASFPTVRSYVTISIMFLAVLLDRPAVALRNVALSALVILVLWPESLIDPGFQMSFAAVVALVSAYEWLRERRGVAEPPAFGLAGGALRLLGGIVLSTLIASLAVAPIGAWHFHKSQQYAVIANLIAIPICNLLVMPAALATLVGMPLGLEAWPLAAMGLGIDGMVWCAYTVAALPGSVARVAAFPTAALLLMVAGGLWLALWRRHWRLLGLVPFVAGVALAFWRAPPDVLVGRGGRLVAVRAADGRLEARAEAADRFDLSRWLEHDGDGRAADTVRQPRAFRCDWMGCAMPATGPRRWAVAVSRHPAGLADDCAAARIVIVVGRRGLGCGAGRQPGPAAAAGVNVPVPPANAPLEPAPPVPEPAVPAPAVSVPAVPAPPAPALSVPTLVLAEPELSRAGAWAIRWRADGSADVRTVAAERGRRPWSAESPQIASTPTARPAVAPEPSPTAGADRRDGPRRARDRPRSGKPVDPRDDEP